MTWLIANWKSIGSVLAVLSVLAYYQYMQSTISSLEEDVRVRDESLVYVSREHVLAVELANTNAQTFRDERSAYKKKLDILNEHHEQSLNDQKEYYEKINEVKHVKAKDDGNVSTSMRNTLRWLRGRRAKAADHNQTGSIQR